MTKRKIKIRKEIIEIIKTKNFKEFQNYFQVNKISLNELNNRYTDILIIAIEYDAPIEIIDYILYNCKYYITLNYTIYKTRNNIVKSPLAAAIEKNNFKLANYLIDLGANINLILYSNFTHILNEKNSRYLLDKGNPINIEFIHNLIVNKLNFLLKQIFKKYIIDNALVLKLISFFKNKKCLTNQFIENLINNEYSKIDFNSSLYKLAFDHNNYEALNILYKYDYRQKSIILNDLYVLFKDSSYGKKELFINKIKNGELNIPMTDSYIIHLENEFLVFEEKNEKEKALLEYYEKENCIIRLIKSNNLLALKDYLRINNIKLNLINKKYDPNNDLLRNALYIYQSSPSMINFIIQQCDYKNLNFHAEFGLFSESPLYYALHNNNFCVCDILIKNGATQETFNIFDLCSRHLNINNMKYLLNNFRVDTNFVFYLIKFQPTLYLNIFFHNYFFNNTFILTLLSLYKNKTITSSKKLQEIINNEKTKFAITKNLYEISLAEDNDEALSILYENDYRPKSLILYELFKILDNKDTIKGSNEKLVLINKIRRGIIKIEINDLFTDYMLNIEEKRSIIKKLIKMNDFNELKLYLNKSSFSLSYLNNEYFDVLIYAIEHDTCIEIIKFLIHQYRSLNYYIHFNGDGYWYKSPLSCAINCNKLLIAKLLLSEGANTNSKKNDKDIVYYIFCQQTLNTKNLKFLLCNEYKWTYETLNIIIRNGKDDFLKVIFDHYIYDNSFIINLIYRNKNRYGLTDQQLKDIIFKEKSKIIIQYGWFYSAISMGYKDNSKALEILFNHIGNHPKLVSLEFLDLSNICILLEKALRYDNYYFIEKLFNIEIFSIDAIKLEEILKKIDLRYGYDITDGLKRFIEIYFDSKLFKFSKINFEEVVSVLNQKLQNKNITEFFIEKYLNNKNFEFENITLFRTIWKTINKENNLKLIYIFLEKFNNPKLFNFENIDFETILNASVKYNPSNRTEYIIDKSLRHKTFNFDNIDFNYCLESLIYQENFYLIKLFIEKSFHHETFDVKKINIKQSLFLLNQINEVITIPILEVFIKELFNNFQEDSLKYINIEELIFISSKLNNIDFMTFVIETMLNHKIFQNNGEIRNIKFIISALGNLKSTYHFKLFIQKILDYRTFNYKPTTIKDLLYSTINLKEKSFIKFLLEKILNSEKFNYKLFYSKEININNLLISAIYHNNTYFLKYIFEKVIKNNILTIIDFKKLLLCASKIDNINAMRLINENLFNLSTLNLLDTDQINLSNIKDINNQYLTLIINSFVKLNNLKFINYIMESNELKNKINLNIKDENGEYPLLIAFDNSKRHSGCIEIFKYLIKQGADINIKDINGTSLLSQALQDQKIITIQNSLRYSF